MEDGSPRPSSTVYHPSSPASQAARIAHTYDILDATYGGEHWHWMPEVVRGPMDVIAGAILVQHTTWRTAERALESLRTAGALDVKALASMTEDEIAVLVRVAGTPSVKARRLRAMAMMIRDAGGLNAFLALPLDVMRPMLLATHGVGPETADAIALYAGGQRTFVVDAYTVRLFDRLGFGPAARTYDGWRRWFEDGLSTADGVLFQRYHAWIVLHSKERCRTRPICDGCPLLTQCAFGGAKIAGA
jgi:endonuclease-3 related protein